MTCLANSVMVFMISACLTKPVCAIRFLFSSRRRHTRFDCDWSSDVCLPIFRVAMGAARWQVLSMVMKNGLGFVLLGLAAGQGMALMLHRTMQGLLVGVSATDALTLLVAAAVLLLVAIVACYVPAWRAARMDPLVALRFE